MKTIIIAYIVVTSSFTGRYIEILEANVMAKINEGWVPYGGVSCYKSNCHQAMVKTREVKEEDVKK